MDGMHRTPIAPLDVEIDGIGKYAPASSVEALTALLTSLEWPNKTPRNSPSAGVVIRNAPPRNRISRRPRGVRACCTPQGCPSSPMTWLRSGRPGKKRPDQEAGSFVLEIRCSDDSTIARPFKLIQAEVISSEIE